MCRRGTGRRHINLWSAVQWNKWSVNLLQMSWHRFRILIAWEGTCTHVSSNPLFPILLLTFSSFFPLSCYYYQHFLLNWIRDPLNHSHLQPVSASATMNLNTSSSLETRSLLDELCNFDKKGLFDLGHPLLNRIVESFVKAAGVSITSSHTTLFHQRMPPSLSLTFTIYI